MTLETELVGFKGLSLILQHRALTERLDAVERAISACQCADLGDQETTSALLPLLRGFVNALPAHFAAESSSKASLLRESSDTQFALDLEQLDSEHPHLLAVFTASVDQLARSLTPSEVGSHVSFEHAMTDLLTAIGEFRSHEAREDALFAGG